MNKRHSRIHRVLHLLLSVCQVVVIVHIFRTLSVDEPFKPILPIRDALLLNFWSRETSLAAGLLALLVVTTLAVANSEIQFKAWRLGLIAVFPFAGLVASFMVKETPKTTANVAKAPSRLPGYVCVFLLLSALAYGCYGLVKLNDSFKPAGQPDIPHANLKVYRAILAIKKAQEAYIKKDWDGDGKKSYAVFIPHLYQSVKQDSSTVPVRLIPKEIALARGYEFTIEEYTIQNLYFTTATEDERLDYEKEWALTATPTFIPQSDAPFEVLQFVSTSNGGVYARHCEFEEITYVPIDLDESWTKIASDADVEKLMRRD